ncbi:MAG: hypothetical protein A3F13_00995 [Gammaproteobacteria bacterium RIFCSPHIGHO2_12_FULL_40_19]|nr:MAG: hypothetical protein A3F13_00995 [Gammaproteobacteria bacterium RIFCSPHIGHO2_12_FULL_40_19]
MLNQYYERGVAAFRAREFEQAISFFQEVLRFEPCHFEATRLMAWACIELDWHEEAVRGCDKLIELNYQVMTAFYNKGVVLLRQMRLLEAKTCFEKINSHDPNYINAQINLAVLHLKLGNNKKSLCHYQNVLSVQHEHEHANYMMAALTKKNIFKKTPKEFIQQLYAAYAANYEYDMLGQLNYRVPELLKNLFLKHAVLKNNLKSVLDLGCGTGLTGQCFKPFTKELIGVDLSLEMLQQSKEKNIYEELYCMQMEQYLLACNKKFDLVYASDSLIYTGDLSALFSLVQAVLLPKAYFLFSVEAKEENNIPYQLNETGRFSHELSYLQSLANLGVWCEFSLESVVIRTQKNEPVKAYVAMLARN